MPESEGYKIEITPEVKNVEKVHTLNSPSQISPIMANNKVIPGSQNHAISYITNIRNRFKDDPETYRSFLRILNNYQKESKGIKEVLENVTQLLRDHPDLLAEFVFFLPVSVREKAKERLKKTGTAGQREQLILQFNKQEDEEAKAGLSNKQQENNSKVEIQRRQEDAVAAESLKRRQEEQTAALLQNQEDENAAEWRQSLFSQKREEIDLVKQLLHSEVGFSPSAATKYA